MLGGSPCNYKMLAIGRKCSKCSVKRSTRSVYVCVLVCSGISTVGPVSFPEPQYSGTGLIPRASVQWDQSHYTQKVCIIQLESCPDPAKRE